MTFRSPLRHALMAASVCLPAIGAVSAVAAFSAEQPLVRVEVGEVPVGLDDAIARLREIAAPAPLKVVAERKSGLLARTSREGYERLLADPDLYSVRLARGRALAPKKSAAEDFVNYEIRLSAADTTAPAVTAAEVASTSYNASLVGRRAGEAGAPAATDAGPGMLLLRAVDETGTEVYRTVVPDPRLVRYEAVDENGRFTGRTDFYRTEATVRAQVPDDPAIVALQISAPSKGAASGIAEVDLK